MKTLKPKPEPRPNPNVTSEPGGGKKKKRTVTGGGLKVSAAKAIFGVTTPKRPGARGGSR
jgi:hypothetical protein